MVQNINNILHQLDSKFHTHLQHAPKLDFIGDVHGYSKELELLLEKLGYQYHFGTWQHPEYKAVFVGDFINRGPNSKKTIKIVRNMVEQGAAYAILGNHEINAICYFTKRRNGLPIRLPGPTNKKSLDRIKYEYEDVKELEHDVKWLRKLPLYYDFKLVRVVHAYWSQNHLALINGALKDGKLKRSFLKDVFKGGTSISKAFMQTTKGVEFCFPPNMVVKDNLKLRRMCYRIKWWNHPQNKTFEELSFETKFELPNIEVPPQYISQFDVYAPHEPPVFVGHYCTKEQEMIIAPNICCIDACIANGGKLAAYRWDGESSLSAKKIVSIKKQKTSFVQ